MRATDKLAHSFQSAEVVFDSVVIYRAVAMIKSVRTPRMVASVHAVPVVVPRGEPDCRHSQISQVRQVIDDTANVAAVIGARISSVVSFARRISRSIVRRVAVAETVWHYQVDDVVRRDALKIC